MTLTQNLGAVWNVKPCTRYEIFDHMRREVPAKVTFGSRFDGRPLFHMENLREDYWPLQILADWRHIELQFDGLPWKCSTTDWFYDADKAKMNSIAAELDMLMCWWDDNQHSTRHLRVHLEGLFDYFEWSHPYHSRCCRKCEYQQHCLKPFRTWLREKKNMPDKGRVEVVLKTGCTGTFCDGKSIVSRFRTGMENDMICWE